jgi:hypothetical protein
VYAEMLKLGLDIMVVTETGLLARDKIREAEGFKVVSLPATQGSVVEGGIAIFVRRHKGLVVEKVCADQERGRWIRILLGVGGPHRVWVCGAYGVSGPTRVDKQVEAMRVVNDWSCQVKECLKDTEHVIFASDSNFIKDSNTDRCKVVGGRRVPNTDHDASEILYHHFTTETGLVDS